LLYRAVGGSAVPLTAFGFRWRVSEVPVEHSPEVFIEFRSLPEGCYAKARIERAPDGLPRTFVIVHDSRDKVISEVTGWALTWLRRLRDSEKHAGSNSLKD